MEVEQTPHLLDIKNLVLCMKNGLLHELNSNTHVFYILQISDEWCK